MTPLKVRSMVGLIPLFAVETLEPELLEQAARSSPAGWNGSSTTGPTWRKLVSRWNEPGTGERRLLSLLRGHRMKRLLRRMLDETEFLSDYGVRALSRHHQRRSRTCSTCDGTRLDGRLPAGRVRLRPVRRQLELARADLDAGELPASSSRCRSSTTTTATTSRSSARPAPANS